MDRIKVLQVNKLYYPAVGGIERTVQHIAEGLRDDVDMEVLVCQPKGRGSDDMVNEIPVRRCASFGTLFSLPISFGFLLELRKRSKGKDILQFHAPFPLGDLGGLLSGYKGKMVLYWHSDVVKQKRLMILYRPIMERFLKRADAIITASEGIIKGSSYLMPYKDKCVVIPFAVNPEIAKRGAEYLAERKEEYKSCINFLFVGRLVYYKGVDVMLRAFTRLEHAELTIVGHGELEQGLKDFAQEKGIFEKVHFLGKLEEEELYKAYEACDVFILPSVAKSEAFGLVQLEAMAYGKPVINTNLPSGVPEVSLDGITGLTVEPGDDLGLSEAMNWMMEYPERRYEMGRAARRRLDENYTCDVMMDRMKALYDKLLKDGKL